MQHFMIGSLVVSMTVACLAAAPCPSSKSCYAGGMPPALFDPGSVILFQGDSITHGGRGGDLNHYLGHGYQALIAQRYLGYRPEMKLQFINRGVSGDTTRKLLARWDKDAIDIPMTENGYLGAFGYTNMPTLHPDVLSLLIGVNDCRDVPPGEYESNIVSLITRSIKANPKLKLVFGEPFRFPVQFTGTRLSEYQAIIAKLACQYRAPLVKYQKLFDEQMAPRNPNPRYWSWDSVHPSYAAHQLMADEWIRTVENFKYAPVTNTAVIPRGKLENDSYHWFERHQRILDHQAKINPEIVFIGDSITHFWAGRESIGEPADSTPHWNEAFKGFRVLNLGYGWDRTQNVLWRLDHGEMDGLSPKTVVLHIGTNNIGGTRNMRANSPAEIADGILEICRRVREKAPKTNIVLMAIFPRGKRPTDFWRVQLTAVNNILKARTANMANLTYLDIGPKLVQPDGTISQEIMWDFCHPTPKGYAIWAEAIKPCL